MIIIIVEGNVIIVIGQQLRGDSIVCKERADAGFIGGMKAISEMDVDYWSLDRVHNIFAPSIEPEVEY